MQHRQVGLCTRFEIQHPPSPLGILGGAQCTSAHSAHPTWQLPRAGHIGPRGTRCAIPEHAKHYEHHYRDQRDHDLGLGRPLAWDVSPFWYTQQALGFT